MNQAIEKHERQGGVRLVGGGLASGRRWAGMAAAFALAVMLGWASGVGAAEAPRLDVNAASVEQLTALPGIGEAKAAAIVEERTRAPFTSVADLERVRGIGPALVAELEKHVSVSSGAER